MRTPSKKEESIPAYEGTNMAGYIMARGFKLPDSISTGRIMSITNIRDIAVIVTEYQIYRARPCHQVGFCIENLFNNL